MAKKESKEHIKKITLLGIPVGRLMAWRSKFPNDEVSAQGIAEAAKIIGDDQEGMAVLFAHLGLLDAFGTVAVMERLLPEFKALFPAAGSFYHFPILNSIFEKLNKQLPYEFAPVFRKEDLGKMKLHVKVIDFSGLSDEEKKQANQRYSVAASETLHQQGGVVMLNPYAGRAPKLEYFRGGPLKLIQTGRPVLLSFTIWNWKKLKYDVYFSRVMKFDENITVQEAHEQIFAEYMRMADLSGVSEKQVLEAKSGTPTGKIIWGAISLALTAYLLRVASKRKNQQKN